jgi:5S rRNA maturation endonuclease (ribonuclease M5)
MSPAGDWREAFDKIASLDPDATTAAKADRGRQLEKVFFAMFDEVGMQPRGSYRPTGEEVDGSFVIAGRPMLLELKWRSDPQPASALYQFMGKVSGKLVGTVGLFVSMSGFSDDAVDALIAGKQLNLILMTGDEVHAVRHNKIDIKEAISRKLRAAAETGSPYFPVLDSIDTQEQPATTATTGKELIIVEGTFDERVVTTLIETWGTRAAYQTVIRAGGLLNLAPLAQAVVAQSDDPPKIIIVADGDGDGAAIEQQLARDLAERFMDAEVLVLEPTLESAMGLFKPDEFSSGRRRFLLSDTPKLKKMLATGIQGRTAGDGSGVVELLARLGVKMTEP